MHILLLSTYDAASHVRWRRALVAALPEHRFSVHTLAPRHYAWRAQGNALAFAETIEVASFDLILACAATDVLTLRGLRPDLAAVPALLYAHDNEFAFPPNPREQGRVERQWRQLLNAHAASAVLFNSRFNLDSFVDGARRLCRRLPDGVPAGLVDGLAARSRVMPVPLEAEVFGPRRRRAADGILEIVWNHRWEWDKGPDRLPLLVAALRGRRLPFRLHVVGPSFRRRPRAFETLAAQARSHPDWFGSFGFEPDPQRYRALLAEADVAISTALHEFQGLALMEAAAAGCAILAPARQAYPHWLPAECLYPGSPADPVVDAADLATALQRLRAQPGSATVDVAALTWSRQLERWRAILAAAAVRTWPRP